MIRGDYCILTTVHLKIDIDFKQQNLFPMQHHHKNYLIYKHYIGKLNKFVYFVSASIQWN